MMYDFEFKTMQGFAEFLEKQLALNTVKILDNLPAAGYIRFTLRDRYELSVHYGSDNSYQCVLVVRNAKQLSRVETTTGIQPFGKAYLHQLLSVYDIHGRRIIKR